tara:strand:+ start:140 stop:679 length:540 start_codon:yes stop_codon:yes gene_type:complete
MNGGYQNSHFKSTPGGNRDGNLNDYATPESAWDEILKFIPHDRCIYEPFYLDGSSGLYLQSKNLNVIHVNQDFYEIAPNIEYDFILTNPPFHDCKKLFTFLKLIDKPFVMLLPTAKIHTNYIASFYNEGNCQLIIPRKRIHYQKYIDGKSVSDWKKGTTFDSCWFCYKMKFPLDIQFSM